MCFPSKKSFLSKMYIWKDQKKSLQYRNPAETIAIHIKDRHDVEVELVQ